MRTRRRVTQFGLVAAVAAGPLLIAGAVAGVQVTVDGDGLPDAQAVLARYRAALHADAFDTRASMHSTGQFVIDGVAAEFDAWSSRPDRSAMRIRMPGMGEIRSGFLDGIGWTLDPFNGARVMEGGELLQARDDAAFASFTRDTALLASATTVERTRLGGYPCVKVRLQWKSGRETFDCYSTETGLLVGTMYVQRAGGAEVPAVTIYENYRETDGVRVPMKVTIQAMGSEQVVTLRSVTWDGVDPAVFEIPAEVRAVMKR